jgi:ribonucleoside-diphosphate reductase alpha chain
LPTGLDHLGKSRTAVCCLSSVNLEYYHEWKDDPLFIKDVMRFLDNVLQDFIDNAPASMERAKYSAMRERSVGLGVMGFHSFLQANNIPMESVMAKVWNNKIFEHIKKEADAASIELASERGSCPDAEEVGVLERFSNKLAIAPTASISIIAGNSSPGIEPYVANSFVQKTLTGSFNVRNKNLVKLLQEKGMNNEQIWSSISTHEGSVQHLDFLTQHEKDVFKTAVEIDQRWIVDLAADRTKYICQAQSVNLFFPSNVSKKELHQVHFQGWKKGLKSYYYSRSTSLQRADKVSHDVVKFDFDKMIKDNVANDDQDSDECLACQ